MSDDIGTTFLENDIVQDSHREHILLTDQYLRTYIRKRDCSNHILKFVGGTKARGEREWAGVVRRLFLRGGVV